VVSGKRGIPIFSELREKKCGDSRVLPPTTSAASLDVPPGRSNFARQNACPAEAQNLQGKEAATVDFCRFKVPALKRPWEYLLEWYLQTSAFVLAHQLLHSTLI